MEMRTERVVIHTAEPAGSIVQEQGVELDYVLPDYYPDVCKLVKCFLTPTVQSEHLSGDRLSYELRAEVRILYCSEESNVLQCVTQTLLFSRTAELSAGGEVSVELTPCVDYVNCRAVSRRRLDVRGAVTVKIKTTRCQSQEVLTDAAGKGMQLRRLPVQYPAKNLTVSQSIILSEELQLGNAQPAILHIVRCDARTSDVSQKRVSGRVMVQGNLQLQMLYACEREGDGSLEPLSFTLPFSQLLDTDEIAELDECIMNCQVVSCEMKPCADGNGDVRALRCEAELRVQCTAVRMETVQVISDAFSTEHPCQTKTTELLVSGMPMAVSQMQVCNTKLACTDGELDCVYDAWCEVRSLTQEIDGQELVCSGMLCWNVLVRESGGVPRLLEQEEAFEHRFEQWTLGSADQLSITARAENCAYTLTGAEEVSLKAELHLDGTITHIEKISVLSAVEVEENSLQPHDFALKLYYGRTGEPVWDIAKRCHTSVEAIMEENELSQDVLTDAGMLLIPIVN